MMRENGFDASVDEATRAKFAEMRYLERSIGKTGRLAVMPLLHGSHKDIWQLNMLESEASRRRQAILRRDQERRPDNVVVAQDYPRRTTRASRARAAAVRR